MMLRSLPLAFCLLGTPAMAQPLASGGLEACAPGGIWSGYERYKKDEWPREAERIKGNAPNVSRLDGVLRLKVGGGKTLDLSDCPYGDTSHGYLYQRYDEAGGFYVVEVSRREEHAYLLVRKATGQLFTVFGIPIWSGDRTRFLTVACSMLPSRGTLSIFDAKSEGIVREGEFPLPCEQESCAARWDHQSWIAVTCTPQAVADNRKNSDFVLMRGSDGSWKKFGR